MRCSGMPTVVVAVMPELWNMAADHAINLLLFEQGFALPAGGLCDRRFRAMTTETIYERLLLQFQEDGGGVAAGAVTRPGCPELDKRAAPAGAG